MGQTAPLQRRKPAAANPEVLNLKETSKFLRLPSKMVQRLVTEQGLPGRKIGKEWRFLRSAIERWLEPARAQGGSILDQFGALADDPTYEEYRRILDKNRKSWNEEVA